MFEKLFWSAKEEGAGIFGFADLSKFLVRYSHLSTVVFRFWCFVWFPGFLQLSFSFSVFVNNNAGFSDFYVQCTTFSGFTKEVTLCGRAKTILPRDLLYSLLPILSFRGMYDEA